ncbi:MAG TPA: hypothetical protein PLM29_03385 [Deltaproteobacteria bacterium]|nr:hypothetical protein [Deltaproteobacteria bacterium]
MIRITLGLGFFLIGVEFLFFTGRLQCDAQEACRNNRSWFRPLSEWIREPDHLIILRIIGLLSLIVSAYLFSFIT